MSKIILVTLLVSLTNSLFAGVSGVQLEGLLVSYNSKTFTVKLYEFNDEKEKVLTDKKKSFNLDYLSPTKRDELSKFLGQKISFHLPVKK
jgi:hypothetical protein